MDLSKSILTEKKENIHVTAPMEIINLGNSHQMLLN